MIGTSRGDGQAERFDRLAALPHGIADTYDYAYGLVRDKTGAFLVSYAPYANTTLPGSGGVVRLIPGSEPREVGFGMRNPLGWCVGPDREVFFTDNQGEWVAANKLCHLDDGKCPKCATEVPGVWGAGAAVGRNGIPRPVRVS